MDPAPPLPRMSVVTPCRNGERFIVEAVESLWKQGYPALEHIVLDACSTDATLSILQRYPQIRVISEPDKGPPYAMSRGVLMVGGEVVTILNVDDFYSDGLLREVGELFAADPELDVVVTGAVMFRDDAAGRRTVVAEYPHSKEAGLWLPELTFGVPGINGWFFRRRVFERVGVFDPSYFFSHDRHFLMRIRFAGLKSKLLGRPGIHYRMHSFSQTLNPQKRNLKAITYEHFRMALDLHAHPQASAKDSRILLAWNAFEGAKLCVRHVLAGEHRDAATVLVALFRNNPLWPFRLVYGIVLRLTGKQLRRPSAGQRA
jgi:glycosyltransferase involved in cell wall biosynthesis